MCGVMAGLTALGGYMQYKQQSAAADAQAKAYQAQAQQAQQNANVEAKKQESIADSYAQETKRLRAQRAIAEGNQRANAGAAGLNFTGSQLDINAAGYDAYNQDQLNLLNNQRNDNYSSRVNQRNYTNQANSYLTAADNVKSQAKQAKIGTILGTAASIYGINEGWKKTASTASNNNFSFNNVSSNLNNGYTANYLNGKTTLAKNKNWWDKTGW